MAILHQPSIEHKELVSGTIIGLPKKGGETTRVELENGAKVLAQKPKFMPKIIGLKVRMQVTEYQWSGEKHYEIKNWRSN